MCSLALTSDQLRENENVNAVVVTRRNISYDLAVAYRICPKVSKPAQSLPFGDDKLRQAETCLRSFRETLGSLRVKIWAILDSCPPEYRTLFERHFMSDELTVIEMDHAGNRATFGKQLEVLLSQENAEFVYFAEDDYLYLPDQFPRMLRFMRARLGVDFVSPYDHPDCYTLELHSRPMYLTAFEDHHWRTAASTCLTFLTSKVTLARYERVFRSYCQRNDDCPLWLSLTKSHVFNPFAAVRYFARKESYRTVLPKSWRFCSRQILFGKRARLWVPVPGMATHLAGGLFSPGVDWLSLMQGAPGEMERNFAQAGPSGPSR